MNGSPEVEVSVPPPAQPCLRGEIDAVRALVVQAQSALLRQGEKSWARWHQKIRAAGNPYATVLATVGHRANQSSYRADRVQREFLKNITVSTEIWRHRTRNAGVMSFQAFHGLALGGAVEATERECAVAYAVMLRLCRPHKAWCSWAPDEVNRVFFSGGCAETDRAMTTARRRLRRWQQGKPGGVVLPLPLVLFFAQLPESAADSLRRLMREKAWRQIAHASGQEAWLVPHDSTGERLFQAVANSHSGCIATHRIAANLGISVSRTLRSRLAATTAIVEVEKDVWVAPTGFHKFLNRSGVDYALIERVMSGCMHEISAARRGAPYRALRWLRYRLETALPNITTWSDPLVIAALHYTGLGIHSRGTVRPLAPAGFYRTTATTAANSSIAA